MHLMTFIEVARPSRLERLLIVLVQGVFYNFFFLPPVYTFTITDPTNIAAFFFFMLIALLVSNVAARDSHVGGWNSLFNKQQIYVENTAIAEGERK